MLSVQLVTRVEDFAGIKRQWKALATADRNASLFNTCEWAESWVGQYWEPGYRLHVALLLRMQVPVGILPLYFNNRKSAYCFLGTGEPEAAEVSSEYVDFLLAETADRAEESYRLVAGFLEGLGKALEVPNAVPSSHISRLLCFLPRVLSHGTGRQYRLVLGDMPSILASFSRKERKKAQQALNRFSNLPELNFALITEAKEQDPIWKQLKLLHQADWRSRGKLGAFHDERFERFHCRMRDAGPEISQWLSVLKCGEEVLAINHYYLYRGALYFYLTASVKESHSRLSPGIMLHLLTFSALAGSGLTYDLLKGGLEDSYKARFCPAGDYFHTLTFYPSTLAGRVAFNMRRGKLLLKRLKAGLEWRLRRPGLDN